VVAAIAVVAGGWQYANAPTLSDQRTYRRSEGERLLGMVEGASTVVGTVGAAKSLSANIAREEIRRTVVRHAVEEGKDRIINEALDTVDPTGTLSRARGLSGIAPRGRTGPSIQTPI
jgi:hypothetical protein